ncbi:MAG: dprA [Rhodocyclales bacterium]|nr:dprA [Rhodocyclales bacterium]
MSDESSGQDELRSWLRLTSVPGIGPERQRELLAAFGLPDRIFAAKHAAIADVIGNRLANKLLDHETEGGINAALAWAAEPHNHILTLSDAAFPQSLLQTADPPCLLYVKGDPQLLNRPAIALVGSRNATAQGNANAEAFARALSQAGLTVVSGMALGIDAAAHRGALAGRGSTVAVIGTGADRVYPASNAALAHKIVENGAIISEFALGTPAAAYNFPRRNRLISGLSRGVLVIEAALGSGSLITARMALEQGREVFAIPGSIHSPLSKGCHQLIKQGAKLVESAQDVLEELRWDASSPQLAPLAEEPNAPDETSRLLALIGFDPVDPDTLSARAGLTADSLFAMLTVLELEGRVERLPGGRLQRLQ